MSKRWIVEYSTTDNFLINNDALKGDCEDE